MFFPIFLLFDVIMAVTSKVSAKVCPVTLIQGALESLDLGAHIDDWTYYAGSGQSLLGFGLAKFVFLRKY